MVLKFSQQILILILAFPTTIFFKSMCIIDTNYFFLEIFKAKRGCALCTNAHYTTLNTVGYMTKTLNQIIFFFLHQSQNIFFSNIGNQNIFLEKTITLPFKLNGRSLKGHLYNKSLSIKGQSHFSINE